MANLDPIDRQLLAELQSDGRITNVELAQRVGLTPPRVPTRGGRLGRLLGSCQIRVRHAGHLCPAGPIAC